MEILDALKNYIPTQYWPALLALPYLGRAYYAIKNGGGLVGIWRSIMFGTNTPKQ